MLNALWLSFFLIAAATGHAITRAAADTDEGQYVPQDDEGFDLADTAGEAA